MIKIDYSKQGEKRIIIRGKSDCFHANMEDIMYITCEEYMCTIYLVDGEKFSTTHSLKCFEEIIKEDDFFKVSRNTLINTEYATVTRMTRKERCVNVKGIKIKVSRSRFPHLKKMLYGCSSQ